MNNVFNETGSKELLNRLNKLTPETKPQWGKMTVSQMLAHCNVTYEMAYEDKHPKPNAFTRFLLKMFVKNAVVGDKPFKKNGQTAPAFLVKDDKNFENEKNRLAQYIQKTQQLGQQHFEGKESLSFGKLSSAEWNNMFYKHLDHHFSQFGA